MLTTYDIFKEEGPRGVKVFQDAVDSHTATGKTKKSAYFKIEGKDTKVSLEILAREFVQVLETGSKPAHTNTPSKEMIAMLKDWAQARGIPQDAVWGIAKKLLRDGQKVNRNVYSEQMNEFADQVIDRVTKEFAGMMVNKIVNAFEK